MATIDLATKLNSGIPPSVQAVRGVFHYVDTLVNLSTAATSKGSALAATDIIECIDIPAQSVIIAAGIEVTTAQTGSTVLTLDLGVTGIDVDNFVDGFDAIAQAAGVYAQAPAAFQPIVIGSTADTLDLLIATLTTTNTGGVFRVWCIYGDVSDTRAPGIAQLRS